MYFFEVRFLPTAVCEKNISKILPKIQKHFVITRHSVNHTKMHGLPGLDRSQITFSSLEDAISTDNEVRFMDAFVDKLDLKKL